MRERLIELITKSHCVDTWNHYTDDFKEPNPIDELADHLLANGIIVPPCKVGDTVYVISRYYAGDWEVYICKIEAITIYEKNTFISCVANDVRFGKINFGLNLSEIGKTVFLTKEEAENALKRKEDEGK